MTDDTWGPVHGPDEPCRTADHKEIWVGMRVVDYDRKQTVVTGEPDDFSRAIAWQHRHRECGPDCCITGDRCEDDSPWLQYDPVCWSQAGHGGHWWMTENGSFDGSRMTTRGVK